jgi:hypothetical protein
MQNTYRAMLSLFGALLLVSSCSDSAFSGEGTRAGALIDQSDKESNRARFSNQNVMIEGDYLNEDDLAINKCLEKFGNHPFDRNQVTNYRKIHAAISVLGVGTSINDTRATDSPELVLISASINILGSQTYKLLNPNAYYCLKVNVNVKAKTIIELACQAKLADNKVNVNALSNTSPPTAKVDVNVLSDVEVVPPARQQCNITTRQN